MNSLMFFLNNNKILFLSWFCAFFCVFFEIMCFKEIPFYKYLIYFDYLLIAFIVFSIFYSFYKSIKNSNINKILAFVLLIFYLMTWIIFPYVLIDDVIDGIDKNNSIRLFISIFINIFFFVYLYHNFKKKSIAIFFCLFFCSVISVLLSIFLLFVGYSYVYSDYL